MSTSLHHHSLNQVVFCPTGTARFTCRTSWIATLFWFYSVFGQQKTGWLHTFIVHSLILKWPQACSTISVTHITSRGLLSQNEENELLKDVLKANMEKRVTMEVYSSKTLRVRELQVVPSNMWGGQGLLGASVRFCSYQGANENVWHVLVSGHRQQNSV